MKKLLLFLLLVPFLATAQQTYFTGAPSGSSPVTLNFRASGTDSLRRLYGFWGGAYNWLYTGTQIQQNFARLNGGNTFIGNQSINGAIKFINNTDTARVVLKRSAYAYLLNQVSGSLTANGFQWQLTNSAGDSVILAVWTPDSIAFKKRLNAPSVLINGSSIFTPTITGSSGTNTPPFIYTPTINQSGTAQYNLFRISPYIQSFGSSNDDVNYLLDIGYRSAAYPGGTHTSVFTFGKGGGFSAAKFVQTGSSAMNIGSIITPRYLTTGTAAQGVGTVENSGMLMDLKSATMGTNLYSTTTTTITNAQAFYLGAPTVQIGATPGVVTVTDASSMTLDGPPVTANSNTVLTNPWTLRVKTGNSYFGGNVRNLLPPSDPLDLVNKRSADSSYAIHLSTVSAMQAYSGKATTVFVTDTLRGGVFNLRSTLPYPVDSGIVFNALGGKYWVRDISQAQGINIQWYGAKADWIKAGRAIIHTGTDSRAAIVTALNAAYKRALPLYIPAKYPYSFGSSDKIVIGQGTVIKGESGFLPWQSTTPGDTVKFAPLSRILLYNHTDGIVTDAAGSVRNQGIKLKDFLVEGMYTGSVSDTTAGVKLYSNSHGNPGLTTFEGFHSSDFGTAYDLKSGNDSQFFLAGAENCRVAFRGGTNSIHITYTEAAFCDTVGILTGSLNTITNNQFSVCKNGFINNNVSQTLYGQNTFYNISGDVLYFKSGSANNTISNNTIVSPGRYAMRFQSSGQTNISANTVYGAAYPAIYGASTNNLTIIGNSFISPTSGSVYAVKLDTCNTYIYLNNRITDYAYNRQLTGTNYTSSTVENYNNIKRRGTNSDNAVSIFYNAGSSLGTPSTLSNGNVIGSINGNVYNSTNETNVIKMVMRANENQSSSALGTAFDFNGIRNGTIANTTFGTIDGNGLSILGATNSVSLFPGTSTGADILRMAPIRSDKQYVLDLFTSGTGVGSAVRVFNGSSTSNNSSFKITAALDTAFINYQDIGTGSSNNVRHVSFNGGTYGSALTSWNFANTALRTSKFGFYQSTNSSYSIMQLTSLISNGGMGLDLIPNGSAAQSNIRLSNQSNTSNFGSFKITTDGDTARFVNQNVGSPTTSMSSVSLLPNSLGTAITDWQWGNTNLRMRNMYFDVAGSGTGSVIIKASTGKLGYIPIGSPGYYLRTNGAGTIPEYTNQLTGIITSNTTAQTITGTYATDSVMVKIGSTGKMGAVAASAFSSSLALKANIASPTFTGTVTLPTGNASVAPLILPAAGALLTSPVNGAIESDNELYYTKGSTRYRIPVVTPYNASPSVGQILVGNGTDYAVGNILAGDGISVTSATNTLTVASTVAMNNYTASGNGSSTTISVPHGLSGITTGSKVIVQALNAASAGVSYVTVDATNVNIVYSVAPASGINNLSYTIQIKP